MKAIVPVKGKLASLARHHTTPGWSQPAAGAFYADIGGCRIRFSTVVSESQRNRICSMVQSDKSNARLTPLLRAFSPWPNRFSPLGFNFSDGNPCIECNIDRTTPTLLRKNWLKTAFLCGQTILRLRWFAQEWWIEEQGRLF